MPKRTCILLKFQLACAEAATQDSWTTLSYKLRPRAFVRVNVEGYGPAIRTEARLGFALTKLKIKRNSALEGLTSRQLSVWIPTGLQGMHGPPLAGGELIC